MGYGGALIWTGLTRNLKARFPDKRIVLVHKRTWRQVVARKPYKSKVIYDNNPDIDVVTDEINWLWQRWQYPANQTVVVHMRDPQYLYWDSYTPERIIYKTGQHAIQFACDVHDIDGAILQPRVELTDTERRTVDQLLRKHGLEGEFICLEPHTKTSFTPNKAWPSEKWQQVVDRLREEHSDLPLVQIGAPGKEVLRVCLI